MYHRSHRIHTTTAMIPQQALATPVNPAPMKSPRLQSGNLVVQPRAKEVTEQAGSRYLQRIERKLDLLLDHFIDHWLLTVLSNDMLCPES